MPKESIFDDDSAITVTVDRDGAEIQITLAEYFAQQESND